MTSIENHFTQEDYDNLVSKYKSVEPGIKASGQKSSLLLNLFFKPFYNYLVSLRDNGVIGAINSVNNHHSDFISVWDSFLKDENHNYSPYNQKLEILGGLLEPLILHSLKSAIAGGNLISLYRALVEKINSGNLTELDLNDDFCRCNFCDKRLSLFSKKWHIQTQVSNDMGWEDRKDCEYNRLHEVEIDCPSGYLIIADVYRLDEFSNLVNQFANVNGLGKERSIIAAVRILASELNYIYLPTGNQSYGIYKKDNELIFGYKQSDGLLKKYTEVGFVNPEMWAVSIIDRKALVDNLSVDYSYEAINILDKHLWEDEETSWNFIQVEPGRYRFRFYPDVEKFEDNLLPKYKVSGIRQLFSLKQISKLEDD